MTPTPCTRIAVFIALAGETGHLLPQSALTLDDNGRLGVRLDMEGITRFRPVALLRETPDGIWIAGLPQTARIITVGQEFVREGRRVIGSTAGLTQ